MSDRKWLSFRTRLGDKFTSSLLPHSVESLWLCPLGTLGRKRYGNVTYLYSLYLEAKALPQCSWGQLYGLCSGWGRLWGLSFSPFEKGVPEISHWHFTWLSTSRPRGLGTSFQPTSSSCFASWIQGGTLVKNVVMARLMAKGHVIQKASPSVPHGLSVLSQSPTQPSENNLFTWNIRIPGVRKPNTMKTWALEADRSPFQSQPFQFEAMWLSANCLFPWSASSFTK